MRPFLLSAPLLLATTAKADKIDDLVMDAMRKSKAPGVMLVVLRDGRPIKMKGYGFANLEHRVPVTPDTIFQSGSIGKQFAAALAMKLVEDGKLSLDDPIVKFLPEGKGKWDGVTVRHLLTHTSGLPDLPYEHMNMRQDYTEVDLVKLIADQKVPDQPGENWRYRNGGYILLGVLLGRVGGKSYGDQLGSRIFSPIGMRTARIISEAEIIPNRAAGYEIRDGNVINQRWMAPLLNTTAHGSIYFSARDLMAYDNALYGEKLLKKSSLEQMWTSARLNDGKEVGYGLGWALAKPKGHILVDHAGAWQGFRSWIGRLTDRRLTVIVLINGAPVAADVLGRVVMAVYEPDSAP